MPECVNCGGYSKYPNGKCFSCYKGSNVDTDVVTLEEKEKGLPYKDWNYRYNMIKGRIAETLIQELFLSLNYNVFRYGMENTIPGIMELLKGVRSDVASQIRRMPDFVVQHRDNKNVYFVEIKFRASENFSEKDLPENYPYGNAYIILVSKKHIKCITVEELLNGREITGHCQNYLGKRKEFELDKEVIKEFCEFAVKFFEGV